MRCHLETARQSTQPRRLQRGGKDDCEIMKCRLIILHWASGGNRTAPLASEPTRGRMPGECWNVSRSEVEMQ